MRGGIGRHGVFVYTACNRLRTRHTLLTRMDIFTSPYSRCGGDNQPAMGDSRTAFPRGYRHCDKGWSESRAWLNMVELCSYAGQTRSAARPIQCHRPPTQGHLSFARTPHDIVCPTGSEAV